MLSQLPGAAAASGAGQWRRLESMRIHSFSMLPCPSRTARSQKLLFQLKEEKGCYWMWSLKIVSLTHRVYLPFCFSKVC